MQDSDNEIMQATYDALVEYGYADLTIEKIADKSSMGKSAIYYHYDDKEDLMISFLDHMISSLDKEMEAINNDSPDDKLDSFLDLMLGLEDDEMWEFHKALSELELKAYHSENFSEKFQELDREVLRILEELISETGAEDPENRAEMVLCAVQGALNRKIRSNDPEDLPELKQHLKNLLDI